MTVFSSAWKRVNVNSGNNKKRKCKDREGYQGHTKYAPMAKSGILLCPWTVLEVQIFDHESFATVCIKD